MDRSQPSTPPAEDPPAICIAGPCSAESREQVLTAARQLSQLGVTHYRASLWKPRTRPGSFEGVGLEGLDWLLEVRHETGMPIGTEVCQADQVGALRDAGIDFVWLGARTVSNPYAVSALADALAGSNITVWVKNPVSPDTSLWMGAIERLRNAGVNTLGAILRGCTPIYHTRLRNYPYWGMVSALRTLYQERYDESLSVLLDPSHIAGHRDLVESVCLVGQLYGLEGWMIESHPTPERALTDAAQQLPPSALGDLLARLRHSAERIEETLLPLRYQIRDLDDTILELLAQRDELVRMVGLYKGRHGLSPYQAQEYELSSERYAILAEQYGLEGNFAQTLYELIHQASVRTQQRIIEQTSTQHN